MNGKISQQKVSLKKIRIRMLGICLGFFLLFALLSARAFELHLTDNRKLSRLAQTQYKRRVVVAPKRGNILDKNGETLAIDLQVESVYATPHLIENPKTFAKALAQALSLSEKKIRDRIRDKTKKFVWIKRRISPEESEKLEKLNLTGYGMLPEYKRFYPNGKLAANLLGAVGFDAKALSGLELAYDQVLKSNDPPLLVEQDAKGRSYAPYALVGLEHPKQIQLTVDKTIQYLAERELHQAVEKARAKGGVALVLEAETGAVLALAVSPTFDPNEYYEYDFAQWRNRAITDVFEPGSIFKAITVSAALESGVLRSNDKLFCENGNMKVGSNTIHDHHGYGWLNLSEIIKFSSNICSYKIAHKMGKERFFQFIQNFGFGSKTGIEAPGELPGLLSPARHWSPIQLGTIGFGQGISTTPLQIAAAYGAIANGGSLMKPYLIREIRDSKGNTLERFGPQKIRQVLSPETSHSTIKLLETVVEKGGTGTQAALPGFQVAGKTGTAQKVVEGQKGYAKDKYVASFVGLAPSQDPKLVVLVSIDEPKGAYYGGTVSGPVFAKIMGKSLAYLKVAPQAEPREQTKPSLAHKFPMKGKALAKTVKETKSTPQPIPKDLQAIPDFTGLSVREALRLAQAKQFKLKIEGSGICHRQQPPAGNPAETGSSVLLECRPPI